MPRHKWLSLCIVAGLFGYAFGYAGFRVTGRIRPFFNQGSFEMDSDDRFAVMFLPLIEIEESWHNAFSEPPAGG